MDAYMDQVHITIYFQVAEKGLNKACEILVMKVGCVEINFRFEYHSCVCSILCINLEVYRTSTNKTDLKNCKKETFPSTIHHTREEGIELLR